MPTYGFRCPRGHEFDRFYKTMSAAPAQVECPECRQVAERQLHGGAGLLFKGSGFYLTDYGKNAHRPKAEGGGKAEGGKSEGGATEGGKSEGAKADAGKKEGAKPDSTAKTPTPKAEKPKADVKPARKSTNE